MVYACRLFQQAYTIISLIVKHLSADGISFVLAWACFQFAMAYKKGGQKTASLFWLNYQDSNLDRQNQNL